MENKVTPTFDDLDAERIFREGETRGNAQLGIDAERASLNAQWSADSNLQAVINGDSSNVGVSSPFGVSQRIEQPGEGEEYSAWDKTKAFFQTENTIGSAISGHVPTMPMDVNYHWADDPTTAAYPELISQFIYSVNPDETASIINNFHRETKNREVMASTSIMGQFGYTALAVATDPVLWPAMMYSGGTALLARTAGVGATMAKVAVASMGNEVIAEVMKHDSQQLRTKEESVIAVAATGLLTALGSGVASKLLLKKLDKAATQYTKELFEAGDHSAHVAVRQAHIDELSGGGIADAGETTGKSASAAKTKKMFETVGDDTAWKFSIKPVIGALSDNKFFKKIGITRWRVNPLIRMSQSRAVMVRMLAPMLADSPYYYKGHAAGEALTSSPSIENLRQKDVQETVRVMGLVTDMYLAQVKAERGIGSLRSIVQDYSGKTNDMGFQTFDSFKADVTTALRKGGQSDNPLVAQSAALVRKELFQPMLERGIKAGVFEEGLRGFKDTYVPRMWDFDRIASESYDTPGGLGDKIYNWYKKEQIGYKEKYEELLNYHKILEEKLDAAGPAYAQTKKGGEDFDHMRRVAHDLKELSKYNFDINDTAKVAQLIGSDVLNPLSLGAFLKKGGGLKEWEGELTARGIGNKAYPGLVSVHGEHWEHAMESAFDAGYFPGYSKYDDISMSEFFDAVEQDAIYKERIYTTDVLEHPEMQKVFDTYGSEAGDLLDEFGVSQKSKIEDIHDALYRKMHDVSFKEGKQALKDELGRLKQFRSMNETEINGYSTFAKMTDPELRQLAHKTVDNIRGINVDQLEDVILPDHSAFKAGPLKDRKLKMDDLDLEDYLVNDIDKIAHSYVRSASPQIEIADKFGDIHMTETFAQLNDAYKNIKKAKEAKLKASGASKEKIKKEMQKIDKEEASDRKDILALRDKLYGKYNRPADPDGWINKSREAVLAVNFMRLLGGMTVSAIADLARPIMEHGLASTMSTAMRLVSSKDMRLMAKDELQAMGIMLESVGLNSINRFGDLTEYASSRSKFEAGLGTATAAFSKASLMPMWNDTLKGLAGMTMQNNMIKILKKGNISKGDIEKFARLGFSKSELDELAMMMNKYAEDADGLWLSNATKWDDIVEFETATSASGASYTRKVVKANGLDLAQRWQAAVRKNANEMIVTPGVGDMPLFMSGPNARILMQFKSFAVSAHSRVLITALQKHDKAALEGVIFAVFLGFLVGEAKNALNGRERADNVGDLIYDAVDRSGLMGMLNEPIQTASSASGGLINPAKLWGSDRVNNSRMQSRNLTGQMTGPTGDLIQDMVTVTSTMGRAAQGEAMTEGEGRTAAKFIPGASLFYIRGLLRAYEEAGE